MSEKRQTEESGSENAFASKVEQVLDKNINPALQMHGGWVKLAKTEGKDVYLELGGGCKGCPGARMTMRYVVEDALRKVIPELGQVIDAASGH